MLHYMRKPKGFWWENSNLQ